MSTRLFGTDGVRGTGRHLSAGPRRPCAASARRSCARCRPAPRACSSGATRANRACGWSASSRTVPARAAPRSSARASIPTPGVAYLTRSSDFTAGVVISASHNPFEDNGIKVFSGGGEKFSEELERHVESIVADTVVGGAAGRGGCGAGRSARRALPRTRARGAARSGRRSPARASSWTAPTARRPAWRRSCSASSGST